MTSKASKVLMAVDIGNTALKIYRYELGESNYSQFPTRSVRQSNQQPVDESLLDQLIPQESNDSVAWRVSSVNDSIERKFRQFITHARAADDYRRLTNDAISISANVEDVSQVGIDRLLAAAGANGLRKADNATIVVDAGSAVTVDFISQDGVFQGGVIFPGIAMQARVLAESTERLPAIDLSGEMNLEDVIGKSTTSAIRNGLIVGQHGAVREVVARISQSLEREPQVFITGGDMRFFEVLTKSNVAFVEDLVPLGIVLSSSQGS